MEQAWVEEMRQLGAADELLPAVVASRIHRQRHAAPLCAANIYRTALLLHDAHMHRNAL